MNNLDIKEKFKKSIVDLWKNYDHLEALNAPGCEYRKSPLAPETIKKNTLLFIGINPSFTEGNTIPDDKKAIDFYTLDTQSDKQIPYFKKFKEFADYCETDWDHLDLLFIRETNQKIIEDLTYVRPDGVDFIGKQLDISFSILKELEPKVIVVANAYASEFFGKMKSKHGVFEKIWQGYSFDFKEDFDTELGTYTISLNSKRVPIFFSGMLSGQRALDLGSLERLVWGVKRVID
jgi:hypothetical protein